MPSEADKQNFREFEPGILPSNVFPDMSPRVFAMTRAIARAAEKKEARVTAQSAGISPQPVGTSPIAPIDKAGWGWAFLIVGGALFVFWGIPALQGKGAAIPGMTRPPGYVPTRALPGAGK